MTQYTLIRKIVAAAILLLVSLNTWSSDFVYVGTYTNDRDGKDYDIILEYDGDTFINLEINVRGDEDSQFCAWEINGEKKIQALYSSFLNVFSAYKSIDDVYKISKETGAQKAIEVEWPAFKLQGRHYGKSSGYEMENLIDNASVQAYYMVKGDVRQLMILAVLIDDYGDAPLKSALNFTSPASFAKFIQLVDPKFLTQRIKLKQELLKTR